MASDVEQLAAIIDIQQEALEELATALGKLIDTVRILGRRIDRLEV